MAKTNRRVPKVYNVSVAANDGYSGYNFQALYGMHAAFISLTNPTGTDVLVRLNGDDEAVLTLEGMSSRTFTADEIHATSIEFACFASGASNVDGIELIVGLV